MELADPAAALRVAGSLLKEGGSVYIPHVLNESPVAFARMPQPFLKGLHLTTSKEVQKVADEAGMEVLGDQVAVSLDGKNFGKANELAGIFVLRRAVRSGVPQSDVPSTGESGGSVRARKGAEAQQ